MVLAKTVPRNKNEAKTEILVLKYKTSKSRTNINIRISGSDPYSCLESTMESSSWQSITIFHFQLFS